MQIVFGIWTSSGFFCFVFLLSRITLFSSAASFFLISFLFALHPSFLSVFHHFPISSVFSRLFPLFTSLLFAPPPTPIHILFSFSLLVFLSYLISSASLRICFSHDIGIFLFLVLIPPLCALPSLHLRVSLVVYASSVSAITASLCI